MQKKSSAANPYKVNEIAANDDDKQKKIKSWVEIAESRKGKNIFSIDTLSYNICTQCVMDTSDPEIKFNEAGVCNHCETYFERVDKEVISGELGKDFLNRTLSQIKEEGKGKKYDCILGLSGGVDSTYVAYLTKRVYGLRPLAVHLDNGWNSETAVRNIENIVTKLELDLYTEVLNWDEFRRLQLSFLNASTPDSEIPTDHAIIATLYKQCIKHKVRWIMDGSNTVTEATMPATWSHGHADWKYIRTLNKLYSKGNKLKTYPHYSYFQYLYEYPKIRKLQRFPLLNYVNFNKQEAMKVMKDELGWEAYGGKHYESIYTRFYQGYILPKKFGFDKRRGHLSCLINNGLISRDEALQQLQQPALDEEQAEIDKAFAIKKLGITDSEFEKIMNAERKTFWDYPSYERDIRKAPQWLILLGVQTLIKSPKRFISSALKKIKT